MWLRRVAPNNLTKADMETFEEKIARVVREHVAVVPYDPRWPKLFQRERHHLRSCLPQDLVGRIEHFGSTAVPGLAAKPIVDILVEVTDLEETKRRIAELYRRFYAVYREHRIRNDPLFEPRVANADRFARNLERAPWFVIPCIEGPMGRADEGSGVLMQVNTWASIYPAVWSFMLALRERGLASCLTTNHLAFEREAAGLLGIPFERVNQACLLPVAYARGAEFRPARRKSASEVVHLGAW